MNNKSTNTSVYPAFFYTTFAVIQGYITWLLFKSGYLLWAVLGGCMCAFYVLGIFSWLIILSDQERSDYNNHMDGQ